MCGVRMFVYHMQADCVLVIALPLFLSSLTLPLSIAIPPNALLHTSLVVFSVLYRL